MWNILPFLPFPVSNSVPLFLVGLPFPVRAIIKPECYVNKEILGGIQITTPQIIMANYEDKETIIKRVKENGIEILDIQKMSFGPLIDLCQKCGKHGIPSIQKKNTDQRYAKVDNSYSIELKGKIVQIPKPKTFWLVYKHNPGLCWVRQWQGNMEGTFKESKKGKFIHPRKFLIGGQIDEIQGPSNTIQSS